MLKLLVLLSLLVSCGKSSIEVEDSNHTATVEGEAFSYIIVKFDFITDIKSLCQDSNPSIDFDSTVEHRRAVSDCTFDNLSILDTTLLSEFNSGFCDANEAYDELSDIDKLKVDEICGAL